MYNSSNCILHGACAQEMSAIGYGVFGGHNEMWCIGFHYSDLVRSSWYLYDMVSALLTIRPQVATESTHNCRREYLVLVRPKP
jgi:hypothetical protein